jgi:6-phosphofructokinase 1
LRHTPGGAFGSCRFKLKSLEVDRGRYERLIAVLRAHDIRYFLYNGGNDSADTSLKISAICAELGYPLQVIGVPKTVDNDLPVTDSCPGFGSVAKYTAGIGARGQPRRRLDVRIVDQGVRHGSHGTACRLDCSRAGSRRQGRDDPPHIILFPEVAFDEAAFLAKVKATVERVGYCTVVVSEGVKTADGKFLTDSGVVDAFGHAQLGGGAAPIIAAIVKNKLGYKNHWAVPDYLQRSARHLASKGRRRTGLRGRQGRGRLRARRQERGDAGHQAHIEQAVQVEDRARRRSRRLRTSRRNCRPATSARMDSASRQPRALISSR